MINLCLAVGARRLAALRQNRRLTRGVRQEGWLVELRLDLCADRSVSALRATLRHFGAAQVLVTCRGPAASQAYVDAAVEAGAAYVDVELAQVEAGHLRLRRPAGSPTRWVLSEHFWEQPPSLHHLQRRQAAAERTGADVVKLAVVPRQLGDLIPLVQLAQGASAYGTPLLPLGIGALGLFTRVLVGRWRQPPPFTFACLEQGAGTAAGQVEAAVMQQGYRFASTDEATPLYGVVGGDVGHSASPAWHNANLQRAGRAGVYLPFSIGHKIKDFDCFMEELAPRLGLLGMSVTLPHKLSAARWGRPADRWVSACGAANTLCRRRRAWWAYNTDAAAISAVLQALQAYAVDRALPRSILIVGAGGVGRAVAAAAQAGGWKIWVTARRPEQAEQLAADFEGAEDISWSQAFKGTLNLCLLVHCTPVGMAPRPQAQAVCLAKLPRTCVLWDLIYAPRATQLLQQGLRLGHPVLDGGLLFSRQAAAQAALFYEIAMKV